MSAAPSGMTCAVPTAWLGRRWPADTTRNSGASTAGAPTPPAAVAAIATAVMTYRPGAR
jgi:hypothetical protein